MLELLSVSNMRKSDANTIEEGISSKELMRRAGEAIYYHIGTYGRILIVCGTGNNAGDGYVLADYLEKNGNSEVTVFVIKNKFSEDGQYYFDKIKDRVNVIIENDDLIDWSYYDTVVDCIFGTGFHGEVTEPYLRIIEKINQMDAKVYSVDINSGLNGDSGVAVSAVKSDVTLAIGSLKPGYYLNDGKDYVGSYQILDIGIKPVEKPYYLLSAGDMVKLFEKRANNSNKGNFGYVALIGGSVPYSGAARLAEMANAAMRSGAGVVMLAVPKILATAIIPNILESTLYPLTDDGLFVKFNEEEIASLIKRVKTIAFGMGIGNNEETKKILEYILKNYDKTLIIDADGLNALSQMDNAVLLNTRAKVVLTPHLKEFSRLTGFSVEDIKNNMISYAMDYAKKNRVILLLKGPGTVITDGDTVYITKTGTPGMATAGSGDVLSGILSAICASNPENLLLSVAGGAYINGRAGELACREYSDVTMIASDTASHVREAVEEIVELRGKN